MTHRLTLVLAALALGLSALAPGCVALTKQSLFETHRDEVYVAFFDNDTFYRGLELDLTERVVDEILSRPGLHLTNKESAEVYLSGRLTDVRRRVLSENPNQDVTSRSSSLTAHIELIDAKSGKVIKARSVTQRGEFVPGLGESVEAAQNEAFVLLARDIVRLLEKDF